MIRNTLRRSLMAALLVAGATTAVEAQAAAASRFGLNAGIALPMGDFGDGADLGFHIGGHWQTGLGQTFKLRVNADLGRYGLAEGVDGSVMLIGATANIVYPITTQSAFKPYVFGGLGMYNWNFDIDGLGSADDTDLALNLGVGYDFKWGTRSLFTEIRYLTIDTEGSGINTLPIVLGIRF